MLVLPLRAAAVCVLLAAAALACGDDDSAVEERLAALEQGQARTGERVDGLESRLRELEEAAAKEESDLSAKEQWARDKAEWSLPQEGTVLERTAALAEASGGVVHYVDHPGRGDRTVLVAPVELVDGETPLIVSIHGFGADSAYQSIYVPLHERVNSHGFALLLPNGAPDAEGNRAWNPTDECCEGGKAGEDDVAYLRELVAEARKVVDFGPVYLFGYSNGGFMAYHVACKGLPGLRAVASLAGTSYVEDSSCEGAPPVSALHVHGTADEVILFEGDETEVKGGGERAFYAGAREMAARWSRRAGCDWPEEAEPYATLDLDRYVPGAETQAFRLESGCAGGVSVELWMSAGSGHAPGYGGAFVDAVVAWLLSQE